MFVDEGVSVVLRVAKNETVAWLTRGFEGRRPKCVRKDCEICNGDTCEEEFVSRKPYLVVQTAGATEWEDWFFTELEAEALSVVQQGLPRISQRGPFHDCAAPS